MFEVNPKYHEIIQREFIRAAQTAGVPICYPGIVYSIWGVEAGGESSNETIYIIVPQVASAPRLYAMFLSSDDDDFCFIDQETGKIVRFPFPDEWLELEEEES